MDLLTQAFHFAIDAHAGALRKMDGSPAALHALEAAAIAASLTDDAQVIAAAALHDTVEDANIAISDIEARFGTRVAALVSADTEPRIAGESPEQSWQRRKQATISCRTCAHYTAASCGWATECGSTSISVILSGIGGIIARWPRRLLHCAIRPPGASMTG